jgi:hypothetical protein
MELWKEMLYRGLLRQHVQTLLHKEFLESVSYLVLVSMKCNTPTQQLDKDKIGKAPQLY